MERIVSLSSLDTYLLKAPQRQKVIIADSNTSGLCLSVLIYNMESLIDAQIIEIEAGEESKNLETYCSIVEALIEQGADKDTVLIALGGGVVCDVASFVASTFKRGIEVCLIPTTTLAMVDAAIGGKNGLNIGTVKNQIGNIKFASKVCIDEVFLETLEARHIVNGVAEMLKTALVADRQLAYEIMQMPPLEAGTNIQLLRRCIRIKQSIVRKDPNDKAERRLLNFGHTIGHAIESLAMQEGRDLLHGEAIANGMYHILNLCEQMPQEEKDVLRTYLSTHFTIEPIADKMQDLFNYMNADKKNSNQCFNLVLLESIGKGVYNCSTDREQILSCMK